LTVVVFKRNDTVTSKECNLWNLIGKYHSHYLPIRDILFGSATPDSDTPRFFSLGEDRELIEYDLAHRYYIILFTEIASKMRFNGFEIFVSANAITNSFMNKIDVIGLWVCKILNIVHYIKQSIR